MAFRCVLAAGTTVIASLWLCLGVILTYGHYTAPEGTPLLFQPKFIEFGLRPTSWQLALPLSLIIFCFQLGDFSDHPQLKRRAKRQLFTLLLQVFILDAANSHY